MDGELIRPPGELPPQPPPLTLYIHLPWCVEKCPYCDFNSHKQPRDLPESDYVGALLRDLDGMPPSVWGRRPHAIFIGGGTPSLFSPAAIERILAHCRALFNPPADAEITMEANPDSADAGKFAEFRAAGVNRLSVGAQSFNDKFLRALGRVHNGGAAIRAVEAALSAFDNVNIDLMHALPQQTVEEAVADVRTAASWQPAHLSLYQLTLEPNTPFYRRPPPAMPDEDAAADIADAVVCAAADAGYRRYEVSAYAKPRRECQHNLNYWQFGDYLGAGAGAHGKITENGRIWREVRIKHPGEYMRAARRGGARVGGENPVATRWRVGNDDAVFEFLLNALRLIDGVPAAMLEERAGVPAAAVSRVLADAEQEGLLHSDALRLRPTDMGLRHLNELLTRLL